MLLPGTVVAGVMEELANGGQEMCHNVIQGLLAGKYVISAGVG